MKLPTADHAAQLRDRGAALVSEFCACIDCKDQSVPYIICNMRIYTYININIYIFFFTTSYQQYFLYIFNAFHLLQPVHHCKISLTNGNSFPIVVPLHHCRPRDWKIYLRPSSVLCGSVTRFGGSAHFHGLRHDETHGVSPQPVQQGLNSLFIRECQHILLMVQKSCTSWGR